MSMDINKLMKQAQQMQSQMQQMQEEAANEVVEASAGGGMVTVKATGGGEIVSIAIDPKAIDPDDPEMLSDLILAAVDDEPLSEEDVFALLKETFDAHEVEATDE